MMNEERERKMLEVSVSAPLFECTDIYGRSINLKDYRGKRLFIGFFRHAGCPFCNLRVHALLKIREELLDKNMEMIFFFESNQRLLQSSIFHREISPVPLIADPEKIWYETYGIENSWKKSMASHLTSFLKTAFQANASKLPLHLMKDKESFSTIPAEFLIDENLIIREVHYANNLTDRLSLDHILNFSESSATPAKITS